MAAAEAEELADALELEPLVRRRSRSRARAALALGAVGLVAFVALAIDDGTSDEPVASDGSTASSDDLSRDALDLRGEGGSSQGSSTTSLDSGGETKAGNGEGIRAGAPSSGDQVVGDGSPDGPTTTDPPSTTTTLPCTVSPNSFEPGCGAFRWATAPSANQRMTATMQLLSASRRVVTVRVIASDPDATPASVGFVEVLPVEDFARDLAATGGRCWDNGGASIGYGPWVPPAPRPGSIDQEVVDTQMGGTGYPPGRYVAYACVRSESWIRPSQPGTLEYIQPTWCPGDPGFHVFEETFGCRDPYASFAHPSVEFTIE